MGVPLQVLETEQVRAMPIDASAVNGGLQPSLAGVPGRGTTVRLMLHAAKQLLYASDYVEIDTVAINIAPPHAKPLGRPQQR